MKMASLKMWPVVLAASFLLSACGGGEDDGGQALELAERAQEFAVQPSEIRFATPGMAAMTSDNE